MFNAVCSNTTAGEAAVYKNQRPAPKPGTYMDSLSASSETQDLMTRTNWIALLFVFAVTLVWCCLEVNAIMDTRGGMAGFHPLVLFAIPVGAVLSAVVIAVACIRKSFVLGGLSLLPILALCLPIFFSYELGVAAWSREIGFHALENEEALKNTDFSSADFDEVPYKDHERMVQVVGFRWSDVTSMIAAKNGVFYGFTVNDMPHVYICPLRNGARGVAWAIDPADDENVRYEYTGIANWYIWTLSG